MRGGWTGDGTGWRDLLSFEWRKVRGWQGMGGFKRSHRDSLCTGRSWMSQEQEREREYQKQVKSDEPLHGAVVDSHGRIFGWKERSDKLCTGRRRIVT